MEDLMRRIKIQAYEIQSRIYLDESKIDVFLNPEDYHNLRQYCFDKMGYVFNIGKSSLQVWGYNIKCSADIKKSCFSIGVNFNEKGI